MVLGNIPAAASTVPLLGLWAIGLVLVWRSPAWVARDRWLATLPLAGVALVALPAAAGLAEQTRYVAGGSGETLIPVIPPFGTELTDPAQFGVTVLIACIVVQVAITVWLVVAGSRSHNDHAIRSARGTILDA